MSVLPLPREIVLEVFRFLKFDDVASCAFVSRQFYSIISTNWKYLARIELDGITILRTTTHHLSLKFGYLNNIVVTFSKEGVIFSHDVAGNASKMLISLTNFFRTRVLSTEEMKTNIYRYGELKHKMFYKTVANEDEISALFEYIFNTFKVNKLNMSDHSLPPSTLNSMLNGIRRATHEKPTYTTIHYNRFATFSKELHQLLKSKAVVALPISTVEDLARIDSSYPILINRQPLKDLTLFGLLIEEWHAGMRDITSFKVINFEASKRCEEIVLKAVLTKFCAITVSENDEVLEMAVRRSSDPTILNVRLETTKFLKNHYFTQSLLLDSHCD